MDGAFAAAGTTPRSSLDEAVGNDEWYLTSWFTVITTARRSTVLTSTTPPFLATIAFIPNLTVTADPKTDVLISGRNKKKVQSRPLPPL